MMEKTHRDFTWAYGLIAGLISGVISAYATEFVAQLPLRFPGQTGDAFTLSLPMALSAGVVFGAIGAVFALGCLRLRALACAAFFALSVLGMFAAAEAATWFHLLVMGSEDSSFIATYAIASPIGAVILMLPLRWLGAVQNTWRPVGQAALWTTFVSVLVALAMDVTGMREPLETKWLIVLYSSWQAAFLVVLSRSTPTRPVASSDG